MVMAFWSILLNGALDLVTMGVRSGVRYVGMKEIGRWPLSRSRML